MALRAAIFDLNGVLIDDEHLHFAAWLELFRRHGFTMEEDEALQLVIGRPEKATFEILLAHPEHGDFDPERLNEYLAERVAIAQELLGENVARPEGIQELLAALRQATIKLAVATSSRWPYTNFVLDTFELRPYFDVVLTAEDVHHGKPDPEIYETTCDRLRVLPAEAVVVEDTPTGIRSALTAKVAAVVGVTTTVSAEQLTAAGATLTVDSFTELTVARIQQLVR